MQDLKVPYATWKLAAAAYLPTYYISITTGYDIFACGSDHFISSYVAGSDATDFETNYKDAATAVASRDEAFVLGLLANDINLIRKKREASMTVDGRPIFLPSTLRDAVSVQYCGKSDDVTNGVVGEGVEFIKTDIDTAGDYSEDFQFILPVEIAGGSAGYVNANMGDYITYSLHAPATVGTSNPGAGSFDKVAIGADINMYVPAENGDWDVDLEEKLNGNVNFTKAVPIPYTGGYFNYDANTDALTVASPAGSGNYILVDADFPFPYPFVFNVWIFGSRYHELLLGGSWGGKLLLPQWKHKITVHKETTTLLAPLSVTWYLLLGR